MSKKWEKIEPKQDFGNEETWERNEPKIWLQKWGNMRKKWARDEETQEKKTEKWEKIEPKHDYGNEETWQNIRWDDTTL